MTLLEMAAEYRDNLAVLRERRDLLRAELKTCADPADRQQLERGVETILKESRRLTNMVEELLDFSKMEDGLPGGAGGGPDHGAILREGETKWAHTVR